MTPPILTAFYAGLCGLFFIWLTFQVVGHRRATRTSLGDGGHDPLNKAIRAHGNAAEQMPLTLLMLGLAEMLGAPALAIHLIGLAFLAGRLMHGLHFTGHLSGAFRVRGMVTSISATALLAIGLVIHAALQAFA